jgi:hypothetical protein
MNVTTSAAATIHITGVTACSIACSAELADLVEKTRKFVEGLRREQAARQITKFPAPIPKRGPERKPSLVMLPRHNHIGKVWRLRRS